MAVSLMSLDISSNLYLYWPDFSRRSMTISLHHVWCPLQIQTYRHRLRVRGSSYDFFIKMTSFIAYFRHFPNCVRWKHDRHDLGRVNWFYQDCVIFFYLFTYNYYYCLKKKEKEITNIVVPITFKAPFKIILIEAPSISIFHR